MKTILYNPIFINPQAYCVFPRLTRYLQPDNESTSEPANYIGTIEVKVIAYGDTTLKRTYTNTDSIDLSEFKNTWIRISLFTKVGSCVLGEWKIGNMESDLPYIDPEVLASLKAVVIVGNKTNNDSDRAIVKNLVDPDNPFVISNAAYTEGSGYADKDSPYYGAFVTDGIDDLITSTKTVQEMLGGSNEITVVSMIHQIGLIPSLSYARNNYFIQGNNFLTNTINAIDKTGIYGYRGDLSNITIVNDILGDKKDYSIDKANPANIDSVFSVNGTHSSAQLSQIAWYWTIIANKVLTTDQINQVIAYFNLDRTLKPDILCNTIKQGITNDNHAEFGDKLIDFSGNGRDIQLNNIAWKGDSGIGKYEVDFLDSSIWNSSNSTITSSKIDCKNAISHIMLLYYSVGSKEYPDIPSFKVIKTGADIDYSYIDETGSPKSVRIVDGVNVLPASHNTLYSGSGRFCGFGNPGMGNSVTITQIPSHAGALCLDGVNDFGKVTGMPIYKDYTVIADYIRTSAKENAQDSPILSKSQVVNNGAFVFNYLNINSALNSYSFGTNNGLESISDSERKIYYQSKYVNDGKSINSGTGIDYNSMWLGAYRDNVQIFFNGAIYSLMSFPYSMSEFLIERQLKKHKLGTLYPDMVEFRPVIKHDDRITAIKYYHIKGSSWINLKPGDYIPVGSKISITTNLKSPYLIANVMSSSLTDIKVVPSAGGGNAYDILGYVTDKSPQKINITIEQDENYVQWNPVVESNVPYKSVKYYKLVDTSWKAINVGDYVLVGQRILTQITTVGIEDEVVAAVSEQLDIYGINKNSNGEYNILGITSSTTPQNINITIDEYIRYEDIVQPYPSFVKLENLDRTYTYTWGDKLKVGDTIRYNSSKNLLEGAYTLRGQMECNGVYVFDNNQQIVVTKEMVFAWSHSPIWNIDDNEPKCILSPRLLRIPNASYKILGYIPDISGHGNHGKINNSAYAGMSGVNGYPVVFGANKTWANESNGYVTSITSNTIHITNVLNAGLALLYSYVKYNGNLQNIKEIPPFKIEIKGLEGRSKFIYKYLATSDATKETNLYLGNGTHELPKSFLPTEALINNAVVGFSISPIEEGVTNFLSDITIKVLPEYEGAYCLDGVDDFVTIPTLSSGGKQVLMKVNWDSSNSALLYDQRGYNNEFAIYNGTNDNDGNPIPAYSGRNNGQTYIDGILNSNIKASELRAITHNITITNELSAGVNKFSPVIGSNRVHNAYFTNMALYDFMLFDDISTDNKIKELNEYVGIEAKVELPPYYWDTYGKTNFDADRDTIQQRGVAVGDYDLTNYNHAYEGMSGYNGYPIILSGANMTYQDKASYVNVVGDDKNVINLTRISFNTASIFSYVKQNGVLTSYNKDIESFKIKVTGIDYSRFVIKYNYISEANATAKTTMTIASDGIYELPKSFASDGSLTSSDVWIGINFTRQSSDIPDIIEDVNVTIEVLPEYENGLAYDGITDYSKNANIPVLTDYTYIYKRTIINIPTNAATLLKGADKTNGGAFIADYGNKWQFNFGQYNIIQGIADGINWQTVNSFNGTSINKGENTDDSGITVAKFSNGYTSMVLYKLILYPKTIPLLQINFLKNLMEKDEIIDLNNPIFIQE